MQKKERKGSVFYNQKIYPSDQAVKGVWIVQNRQELCLVMSGWAGLRRHIYKTSKGKESSSSCSQLSDTTPQEFIFKSIFLGSHAW